MTDEREDRWFFHRQSDGRWTTVTVTVERDPSPTLRVSGDDARYEASKWMLAGACGVLMSLGYPQLSQHVLDIAEKMIARRRGEES